ncbi:MAG: type II secretion system F family protein [wastewater metagenome]|nr:type II secretion system F family protein [Candidatus Loosdrechtia aerotolerans]
MSYFEIKVINAQGEFVLRRVRARNAEDALNRAKTGGFFPVGLLSPDADREGTDQEPSAENTRRERYKKRISLYSLLTHFQGIKKKDIAELTRKLRIFIQAGMPLYQSLSILHAQTKKKRLAGLVKSIADDVEAGKSFAESLEKYPKYFHTLYTGLIRAGENSGNLIEVLTRLEHYLNAVLKRKSKLISAAIYPSIVVLMTFGIISLLNVFIIPKFEKSYRSLQMELPKITTTVLSASTWISTHWYTLFLIPLAIIVLIKVLRFTKFGRYWLDYLLLMVPLVGNIVQKANLSLFYRTAATLLQSGVMILDTLKMAGSVIKNVVVNREIGLITKGVYEGKTMNEMMKQSRLFDPFAVHMVEVGEMSGTFGEMLEETSDVYDEELDILYKRLESMLEPLIIIILAAIVGTVIIALYMPMVKLTQTIGNIR